MQRALLSFGQLEIFRRLGTSWGNNLADSWELPHGVTTHAVRDALIVLARRHEILRTTYQDDEVPIQIVHDGPALPDVVEMEVPDAGAEGAVAHIFEELVKTPIDLLRSFSWKARVITERGAPKILAIGCHPIVADAWGKRVLRKDFEDILRGDIGQSPGVTPSGLANIQRSAAWQARRAATLRYLERIWASSAAPEVSDDVGGRYIVGHLDTSIDMAGIRSFASGCRVRPAHVMLAIYTMALSRTAGLARIPIYSLASNRWYPGVRSLVCAMAQAVPILCEPAGRADRADLADLSIRLAGLTPRAYRHSCYDRDEVDEARRRAEGRRGISLAPRIFFNHLDFKPREAQPEVGVRWSDGVYMDDPRMYLAIRGEEAVSITLGSAWSRFTKSHIEASITLIRDALQAL